MKITFTLLLLLMVQLTWGQLTVSTNTVKWIKSSAGNATTDYDTTYNIKNTNYFPVLYRWKRLTDTIPTGWKSEVCDIHQCYASTHSTDTFTLGKNTPGVITFHILPNGVAGTGKIRLKIWNPTDTADVQITTFNINITTSGITTIQPHTSLNITYNSMAHHLVVKGFQDAGLQLVEIYNMLGEKMISTSLYNNIQDGEATIDLNNIQPGVYFARLINTSNQAVTIKKFIR